MLIKGSDTKKSPVLIKYMNVNRQKTQLDRLELALNSNRPGEVGRYISNSINFMKDKQFGYFQSTRFIELFYLAKVRPDAYDYPDIHARILEDSNFPEGLATTLFLALGHAYKIRKMRFPTSMLHLLYKDINGTKEFCNFDPAKILIEIIVNFYFYPRDRLKPEIANVFNQLYIQLTSADHQVINQITNDINNKVSYLLDKPSDKDSTNLDILLTFLPLPKCTETAVNFFPTLIKYYSHLVPNFLHALINYFKKGNADNQQVRQLLTTFSNLKVEGFEAEHQSALAEIERENPSLGIYTVNIDGITGIDILQTTLMNNDRFDTIYQRLLKSMESKKLKFSRIKMVLEAIIQQVDPKLSNTDFPYDLGRILFIFMLFFKCSIIEVSDALDFHKFQRFLALVYHKSLTDGKLSDAEKSEIFAKFDKWFVPITFEESGLPTDDETVSTLLLIGMLGNIQAFSSLYKVLYYAALFQRIQFTRFNLIHDGVIILNPSNSHVKKITNNIKELLQQSTSAIQLEAIGKLFSFTLIITAPSTIGVELWTPDLAPFLIAALDDDKTLKYEPVNVRNLTSRQIYQDVIMNFARSVACSGHAALHTEPYISYIISNFDPSPPQRWFFSLNYGSVQRFDTAARMMFLFLSALANEFLVNGAQRYGLSLMPTEEIERAINFVLRSNQPNDKRSEVALRIAPYLASPDHHVRVAAYTSICVLGVDNARRPRFILPNHSNSFNYVGQAIIIENDLEMITDYKFFLQSSDMGHNAMLNFQRKCPIKFHSLCGESVGFDVDPLTIPDMNAIQFPVHSVTTANIPDATELALPMESIREITELKPFKPLPPIDLPERTMRESHENQVNSEFCYEPTGEDAAYTVIYNSIASLEPVRPFDATYIFACSVLKRILVKNEGAFEQITMPMLPLLKMHFAGNKDVHKEHWVFLTAFLSIVALRKRIPVMMTESEKILMEERIFPVIREIAPPAESAIQALMHYILNESSNLASFIVPPDISMYMVAKKAGVIDITGQLEFTLMFEHPDDSDRRVMNLAFEQSLSTMPEDFVKLNVALIMMAASKDYVNRFFDVVEDSPNVKVLRTCISQQLISLKSQIERVY